MIKLENWTFKKHILLSLALTSLTMIDEILAKIIFPLFIYLNAKLMSIQAANVEIIGGVDGPIAIFYSDNLFRSSIQSKFFVFVIYLFLYRPTKNYINKMRNSN